MPLASLLDFWKRDPETAPNLVAWQTLPARQAQTHPFPEDLPAPIQRTLIAAGIHYVRDARHWVCYELPRPALYPTAFRLRSGVTFG